MQIVSHVSGLPFLGLADKSSHCVWGGSAFGLPVSLLRLGVKAHWAAAALGCQLYSCCILSIYRIMQLPRLMLHLDLILLKVHIRILHMQHWDSPLLDINPKRSMLCGPEFTFWCPGEPDVYVPGMAAWQLMAATRTLTLFIALCSKLPCLGEEVQLALWSAALHSIPQCLASFAPS